MTIKGRLRRKEDTLRKKVKLGRPVFKKQKETNERDTKDVKISMIKKWLKEGVGRSGGENIDNICCVTSSIYNLSFQC